MSKENQNLSPGDWTLVDDGPNSGNICRGQIVAGNHHIADLIDAVDNGGMTPKQWKANATAIAASKAMLKSLLLVQKWIAMRNEKGDTFPNQLVDSVAHAVYLATKET